MPGFGTTQRTRNNAVEIATLLGVTLQTITIDDAVRGHFQDIGHPENQHDIVYENAEEKHFMESSISALLNSFIIKDVKLFLHKYVRNYDDFGYTKSKNNIIIIN